MVREELKDSLSRMKAKAKSKLDGSSTSSSSPASYNGSMARPPHGSSGVGGSMSGSTRVPNLPTSEMNQLANDPNFIVEFAMGDPFPDLIPQQPDDPTHIRLTGVYYNENKRFLLKKAHFSHGDRRIFDISTGHVILASHHPGKNPYEEIDPLGYNEAPGGEWKSNTTVTSVDGKYPSFNIRPKTLSRHGTQYVDLIGDTEDEVLSVSKMGKTRSKSMRPHFVVGRYKEKGKGVGMAYKIVGDIVGRTLSIENARGELVAVMSKTNKALLKTAVFGSGSESTIDVAPGVDCSTILCIIFALGQVGAHYVKDAFSNFVQDPIQDAAVESAMGAVTGDAIGDTGAVGELTEQVGLDDELDAMVDGLGGFVEDAGVADFANGMGEGAEEFAGEAMDFVGEAMGFFFDLFGGE